MPDKGGLVPVCRWHEVVHAHCGATLKVFSDAKKRNGLHWTFQVLGVPDGSGVRWFYRHNMDVVKLRERMIVTRGQQERWQREKAEKRGARLAYRGDYKEFGYGSGPRQGWGSTGATSAAQWS